MAFTLGIDYGTNSVRALLVDVSNGRERATCVVDYPSGNQGILLDPRHAHVARQHPGDGSGANFKKGRCVDSDPEEKGVHSPVQSGQYLNFAPEPS
jgi:hypothetical protein